MSTHDHAPWVCPVEIADLSRSGTHLTIEADSEAREKMAEDLGIVSVDRLAVDAVLTPDARGGVGVKGSISADVTQSCVVTIEPVEGHVQETFERRFQDAGRLKPLASEAVLDLRFDEDDPPEPLEGHTLDIGAIAFETLALGLDPYPRARGAVFTPDPVPDRSAEEKAGSPFAVLETLKSEAKNAG